MTHRVLVIGAGFVGRAAAWDLTRRGHDVTIADRDASLASEAADSYGATALTLDVEDEAAIGGPMSGHNAVVAAVPYRFGVDLAAAAIDSGCHYFDFGGNPTVVQRQLLLDDRARAADLTIVPDCGLAPGLANVLAASLVHADPDPVVESVQIRVGCLPQQPIGSLQYQLAFYPGGLINEYVEPCDVIERGVPTTVEPLTRFEIIDWPRWGPLEAFSTAGGTSTMCQDFTGTVGELEYKTLRYPGHGRIFAALQEIGLLDSDVVTFNGGRVAPRSLVEHLLADRLPRGMADVVLVRVSTTAASGSTTLELEDVADDKFSALARTTAFPATALCDLVLRGGIERTGCAAMHNVVAAGPLLERLESVGLVVEER
jgi:lysine 6-dehydrogenase